MRESELNEGDRNREDGIDDEGRNATQQRMDAEGIEERPVDVSWQPSEGDDAPAEPHGDG
jgi:hypothetical protein